jgi:hypothetical protein
MWCTIRRISIPYCRGGGGGYQSLCDTRPEILWEIHCKREVNRRVTYYFHAQNEMDTWRIHGQLLAISLFDTTVKQVIQPCNNELVSLSLTTHHCMAGLREHAIMGG